jgi:hypothetical protein
MVYRFTCPVPCNRVIKVYAHNDDDAVKKIITAGAINCRNMGHQSCCEKDHRYMPPLPEKKIREIVQLSMELE